jgi:mono/diheme cytochrome c family protein
MRRIALVFLTVIVLGSCLVWWLGARGEFVAGEGLPQTPTLVQRGEYLVRSADCVGCHTARGQASFAGGRVIPTPFGALVSPNLTPDTRTGIGEWSADDFWNALHNGRGRDGRFLYPAFPFPNYTLVTRPDSDAMFAYLRTLPAASRQIPEQRLDFPFSLRPLMVFWRALYFRAGVFQDDPKRTFSWNRGAYLVQGLGHCDACHTDRNVLGATKGEGLSGARIPITNWYAPSLASDSQSGIKDWPANDLVTFLRTGVSSRTSAFGPMAEVVQNSMQYLTADDLMAINTYLRDPVTESVESSPVAPQSMKRPDKDGEKIYERYCADCHQSDGAGFENFYPPLAGNRSVTMNTPINAIRLVLAGGFAPVTEGNPRPFGMPPFGQTLTDQEIAEVLNYVRNSWGNASANVLPQDVDRLRNLSLD